MSIQNRLKLAREMKKMDRRELAEKVGVTVSSISNYENGISVPKTEIMYKLLSVLEIDANFIYQEETDTVTFKDRLKQARLDKKLTQSELAKKVGVTKSAIANYETGVSQAKNEVIKKLCSVLEIDANFLFQDEITSVDRMDRALKIKIDLRKIINRRLYSDELALKEKTCAMVNNLDFEGIVKAYIFIDSIYELQKHKQENL